jgi:hypothetical protein
LISFGSACTKDNITTGGKIFRRLLAALAIGSALFCQPSHSKAVPTSKCWLFEQKNKFLGDTLVYASPKGIKVISAHNKWIEIAKAPNWDLYLLGPASHLYYRWELKKWRGHPLMTVTSRVTRDSKPVMTNQKGQIAGLTAVKYVVSSQGAARSEVRGGVFWICRDLKLPEQVSHVMSGNTGIPQMDGIPLRAFAEIQNENPSPLLNTTSARTQSVPDDFFNWPAGYKLAKSPEEIIMGGITDLVKDFADDLETIHHRQYHE